ncbi:peroxisomal membrane anchor protein conserved region-domain-containing protein [Fusarium flagelliforme]|uniref:Peroxisomal membrane protein PEX14 n=1 Tax=Fusarium flagelliforme TaxID=2675880 RepID=A0A395MDX8_9HYPO|nr:peroxisomal membrane anchor protein conserved region-domain-containing protein [Fusarium flagelliforme]KAH7173680.1 peroxisomal membrane anchor protein conserved region-domain-containing protein [Fusarium flagelliforme]RFN46127.1 peroxin 14 17 [Fusarium flagelliforme]
MSDSDSNPAIPSWQKAQSDESDSQNTDPVPTPSTSTSTSEVDAPAVETTEEETTQPENASDNGDKLEVARRFLENDAVRDAPHEKKVEFLKSKGIDEAEINTLLGQESSSAETDSSVGSETASSYALTPTETLPPSTASQQPSVDRPPIVTYPEFLANSPRPPPLVTKERLFNALYAVTGISTLVYGTSRYVIRPMVDSQAEARTEFHDLTSKKLDALVAKLEKTVSEVPPKNPVTTVEEESDAEDPTEMFHRDMGTQTTFPISSVTALKGSTSNESPAKHNTNQLASLNKTLSGLKDEYRSQSEGMDKIKSAVDVLRDDLDTLTYTAYPEQSNGYDLYGRSRKPEPDDEIRKVRDSIRRVKGVLLSTRNFPASAR